MASTYTGLGANSQATGENAGTWGTKTNTNLQALEQISGGFTQQSIAGGAQTTTLSVSDGSTGATLGTELLNLWYNYRESNRNSYPLDAQTFYFLRNSTSGAYTVQFKYASGSGRYISHFQCNRYKGDSIVYCSSG